MSKISSRRRDRGRKHNPPCSRKEGAIRIGRYMRWLYGKDTPPTVLAGPLIDATFDEIAAIEDVETRNRLLRETTDRAYEGLAET